MNTHLKNFYDDEAAKSPNNDSITSNVSQSFSTPQQNESTEYDKRKFLLHKKLKSYEKRRQKLLYESKKEQEASKQIDSDLKSDVISESPNVIIGPGNLSDSQNSSNLGSVPNQTNALSSNIFKQSNRSDSFLINNTTQFKQSLSGEDHPKQNLLLPDDKNTVFYINNDTNMSNLKFNNIGANESYQTNEDNSSNQVSLNFILITFFTAYKSL